MSQISRLACIITVKFKLISVERFVSISQQDKDKEHAGTWWWSTRVVLQHTWEV